ncbi:acid-sensing (proton-gated) ion channel [Cichlidogyrus casuarinus]|uniref:Acid-sensing (Proton-gated) ion channel n=1 Tax=Cichlidogyrus casuarinus TaxID=1844966 RepID=A0ABD2QKM8_9PLAT
MHRFVFLVICLSTATFTIYRVRQWLSNYTYLSSKMMLSPSETEDPGDMIKFPTMSICNLNPARGIALYTMRGEGNTMPNSLNYELFTDAYHGRVNTNVSEPYLSRRIYQIIDFASHQLESMLYLCRIGHRKCGAENFTKSLLPFGSCYTLETTVQGRLMKRVMIWLAMEEVQLILDPQGFDYLVPSSGLVGFRLLLHAREDPLWSVMPSAIYAGLKFHTIVHATGIKTVNVTYIDY